MPVTRSEMYTMVSLVIIHQREGTDRVSIAGSVKDGGYQTDMEVTTTSAIATNTMRWRLFIVIAAIVSPRY